MNGSLGLRRPCTEVDYLVREVAAAPQVCPGASRPVRRAAPPASVAQQRGSPPQAAPRFPFTHRLPFAVRSRRRSVTTPTPWRTPTTTTMASSACRRTRRRTRSARRSGDARSSSIRTAAVRDAASRPGPAGRARRRGRGRGGRSGRLAEGIETARPSPRGFASSPREVSRPLRRT